MVLSDSGLVNSDAAWCCLECFWAVSFWSTGAEWFRAALGRKALRWFWALGCLSAFSQNDIGVALTMREWFQMVLRASAWFPGMVPTSCAGGKLISLSCVEWFRNLSRGKR